MVKQKETAGKQALFFMLLCTAVYFTSYLTRYNYGAVIDAMASNTGIIRENAGLVSTTAFFTYGIGQLISGFIGDKVRPRLLIVIGMTITAICNLIMPFMGTAPAMMVLWGINGFAQAMFWPPLVRMMADNLSYADYNKACIWVSMGASAATILVYLLGSLCTAFWSWRTLFYICTAAAIAMAVVWQIFAPKKDISHVSSGTSESGDKGSEHSKMGIGIMLIGDNTSGYPSRRHPDMAPGTGFGQL